MNAFRQQQKFRFPLLPVRISVVMTSLLDVNMRLVAVLKPSCLEDVSQVAGEDLLRPRYYQGTCTVVRTRRSPLTARRLGP